MEGLTDICFVLFIYLANFHILYEKEKKKPYTERQVKAYAVYSLGLSENLKFLHVSLLISKLR